MWIALNGLDDILRHKLLIDLQPGRQDVVLLERLILESCILPWLKSLAHRRSCPLSPLVVDGIDVIPENVYVECLQWVV